MIIASTHNVDDNGPKLDFIVPLRETPFPGDTIALKSGTTIRVLRRQFNELVGKGDDQIDVELGVRLA